MSHLNHNMKGQSAPRRQDRDLQRIAQCPSKEKTYRHWSDTKDVLPRSIQSSGLSLHWLRQKKEEREEQRSRRQERARRATPKRTRRTEKHDPPQACTCVTHQQHARHTIATKTAKPHRHMRNITAPATTSAYLRKGGTYTRRQNKNKYMQHLLQSPLPEDSSRRFCELKMLPATGVPFKKPPHPTA